MKPWPWLIIPVVGAILLVSGDAPCQESRDDREAITKIITKVLADTASIHGDSAQGTLDSKKGRKKDGGFADGAVGVLAFVLSYGLATLIATVYLGLAWRYRALLGVLAAPMFAGALGGPLVAALLSIPVAIFVPKFSEWIEPYVAPVVIAAAAAGSAWFGGRTYEAWKRGDPDPPFGSG